MAVTWNADFDNSPKGSDAVGQMDDKIRETRQAVRERVEQEHLFDKNTSTQQGLHKMGSARVWLSGTEPDSPIPTAILTETAGDESKGRLWVVTSSGVPTGEVKVYDGTDWVSMPGSTAASILTLLKTVDGAGSGLDADLWDGKELADLALSDVGDDATYAKTDVAGAGAANDIGDATGATTANKLLTLVKTVDGSGSGLDADTVRGKVLTSYTAGTTLVFCPTRAGDLTVTGIKSSAALVGGISECMRRGGTVRATVKFSHSGYGTTYARWYKNGSPWGSPVSNNAVTPVTLTEDLSVSVGDNVYVMSYNEGANAETVATFSDIIIGVAETVT